MTGIMMKLQTQIRASKSVSTLNVFLSSPHTPTTPTCLLRHHCLFIIIIIVWLSLTAVLERGKLTAARTVKVIIIVVVVIVVVVIVIIIIIIIIIIIVKSDDSLSLTMVSERGKLTAARTVKVIIIIIIIIIFVKSDDSLVEFDGGFGAR